MKYRMGLIGITLFMSSMLSFNSFAQTEPVKPVVNYDKKTDELSVTAKDASYRDVMAQIATLTGIEILMDPKAEHHISYTLNKTPLEKALKDLSRETSVAFVYSDIKIEDSQKKTSTTKSVITSMQILPKGEAGTGNLQPLLQPGGEAFIREKNRALPTDKQPKIFDLAQQRWDARLKKMPPEKREKLIADAKEKVENINKRKEEKKSRHEAHQKEREQRDRQHETERQAHLEGLKTTNPAAYEIKMREYQQAEQLRNQAKKPAQQ